MSINKLNNIAAASTLIVIVFTSLIFSSMMITYFLYSMYGIQVAGIDLPQGNINFPSSQDFTTNQINSSIIDTSSYGVWEYQSGIGRVLIQKAASGWTYLLINNIQPDGQGIITNTYHINNSVKQDYTIVLRYTGGSDQTEITITDDGIHVPMYVYNVVISSPLIISYPNMNQIEDVIITTKFNNKLDRCDINFNGNNYYIDNLVSDTNPLNLFGRHYGGVATDTLGFTLKDFNSVNSISYNTDTDIWVQVYAFLAIAFKLVVYNVDSQYLPWELNIMLIKTQTIALLVGLLNIRSSG